MCRCWWSRYLIMLYNVIMHIILKLDARNGSSVPACYDAEVKPSERVWSITGLICLVVLVVEMRSTVC